MRNQGTDGNLNTMMVDVAVNHENDTFYMEFIRKHEDQVCICNQSTYKQTWDISYSKRKGSWDLSLHVHVYIDDFAS